MKDLGITRYSKLQYKVIREKDVLEALKGSSKRDFFESEKVKPKKKDETKNIKTMRKELLKQMGSLGNKI